MPRYFERTREGAAVTFLLHIRHQPRLEISKLLGKSGINSSSLKLGPSSTDPEKHAKLAGN